MLKTFKLGGNLKLKFVFFSIFSVDFLRDFLNASINSLIRFFFYNMLKFILNILHTLSSPWLYFLSNNLILPNFTLKSQNL